MSDTGRYHRIADEAPEETPRENGNGHTSTPETLDVHQVAVALVELTKEVRQNRVTFEDADNRRWRVWAAETEKRDRLDEQRLASLRIVADEQVSIRQEIQGLARHVKGSNDAHRGKLDSVSNEAALARLDATAALRASAVRIGLILLVAIPTWELAKWLGPLIKGILQ